MRRRQPAASSSSPVTETNATNPDISPESAPDSLSVSSASETAPVPVDNAPAANSADVAPAEKPKPAPRRRATRKAVTPDSDVAAMETPAVAPSDGDAAPVLSPVAPAEGGDAAAPDEKPKRPRRRTVKKDTESVATDAVVETNDAAADLVAAGVVPPVAETVEATGDAAVTPAADDPAREASASEALTTVATPSAPDTDAPDITETSAPVEVAAPLSEDVSLTPFAEVVDARDADANDNDADAPEMFAAPEAAASDATITEAFIGVAQTEIEEFATEDAAAEGDAPSGDTPGDKPRRSRRRSGRGRGAGAAASAGENGATDAAPAPVSDAPAPSAPTPAPPANAGGRGGRGGRGGGNKQTGQNAQNNAPSTPTTPNANNGGNASNNSGRSSARAVPAPPAPSGQARVRGGRRIPVDAGPAGPATANTPVIDLAGALGGATGAEGKPAAPRRVRGLRQAAPARAVSETALVAAPDALAPVAGVGAINLPPAPYKPLPDETLTRLASARIEVRKGTPEILVNDEPRLPLWFFVNTETEEGLTGVALREVRLAYEAGIRTFTLLAHLPWRAKSGERRFGPLDDVLNFLAENAPDALVIPRLIFSPPQSWERANNDEMAAYADGEPGDVSIASRAFWDGEATDALRAAVEHVAEGPHAARVVGFYLEHGEWLHEKGRGFDLSPANALGFRAWLKSRYKNNQVDLRASWHDGAVTFDNAEIPTGNPPVGPTLFFGPREARWSDFHEYASDVVAQTIVRLARVVKEASGGRSLVATSYGYTLELARAASGHLSLAQVLASPDVDILTGPLSYAGRTPGGSAPFAAPIESVTLAGKLWISEDDTKTHLAGSDTPDAYNPKIANAEGTRAVHARNLGAALAKGAGVSWMDLWGDGWLDDRESWQAVGYLRLLADKLANRRRSDDALALPPPDVAVIVDERSFFGVRDDERLLGQLVAHQRDALIRSGARVGFYLLSDLAKPNFPSEPKLLLFLNAFRIPADVRTTLKKRFQNDGRTLAWVYGPGALESENAGDLADVIGMQIRPQPWGSKVGTQVLSGGVASPLTDGLRGQKLGEETRVNPSFFVADPKAQVLGEYVTSGAPSLAVRKHDRWRSVFIGEATLPLALLRGLYKLAGVPVYTVDDDAAFIGEHLISLHSAPGGGTTVYLPEDAVLYDLLAEETLATNGFGARLSMPMRGTRLLFYGTASEVARLGGDPDSGADGLTQSELPAALAPFVFEGDTAPAAASGKNAGSGRRGGTPNARNAPSRDRDDTVSAEDEALMAAALAGEFGDIGPGADDIVTFAETATADAVNDASEFPASPAVAESDASSVAAKKRRRRRGRGRTETIGAPGEEDDDENAAPTDDANAANTLSRRIATMPLPEPPGPIRARPSLAELLPQSDTLENDADLPPVPDEFLPRVAAEGNAGDNNHDNETGGASPAETDNDTLADAETLPVVVRRRRYRRAGRAAEGGGAE